MAKATVTKVVVENITLTLSLDEAVTLRSVVGHVVGNPDTYRADTDVLFDLLGQCLRQAGLDPLKHMNRVTGNVTAVRKE